MEIRPYKFDKKKIVTVLLSAALLLFCPFTSAAQESDGAQQLGMALEYFQAGKYHESLLIFQQLGKRYKLNPRFQAYIALCYYYEWDYKKAVELFDKILPELQGLAPHELSVYYYAAAESYFQMQDYVKALPYYGRDLAVCYDREKGDIYYRMGLCHMFSKEWGKAYDCYTNAEQYYRRFRNVAELEARLAQISNMKRGCLPGIAGEIDDERGRMLNAPVQEVPEDTVQSPWNSVTVTDDASTLPLWKGIN